MSSPTAAVAQTTQQYTASSGVPVKGDFDGDGRDDVFWYVAGSGADALWLGKAHDPTSPSTRADRFTAIPKSISGTYTPLVGDFNGDTRDDIFWFGPGTAGDALWFGQTGGVFSSAAVNIAGSYTPVVGNFNAATGSTSADDIFWYNPNGSYLWSGSASGFATQGYLAKPPKGAKVYAGNWRQSPTTLGSPVYQDLLFYAPGTTADSIWTGDGLGGFTPTPLTINGNYDPIIGNFDATTTAPVTTDIFWYAPGKAADSIWMNTGSSFANVKRIEGGETKDVVVNGAAYKPVVIPAKTAGQADDIYWNVPTAGGETIWNMTGTNRTFAYNVVNLSDFGASDPGARTPLVGDFDVQDYLTSQAVVNSKIAAGDDHTCAITPAGGVQCWGANASGQLGNGTTVASLVPVDVTGLTNVVALTAGGSHTCAITLVGTDNGLKCWGSNANGQLGNGTTLNATTPVDVIGLTTGVLSADAGTSHTCAVINTGTARCWGLNSSGQLGNGTTTQATSPVVVSNISSVGSISAGTNQTCAVNGAAAVCWGLNSSGQVGNGNTTNATVPATAVATSVSAVATGTGFSCALTSSGGVKCWGSDANGTQGNGSGSSANVLSAADVSGVSGYTTLLAGANNVCARTVGGSGQCWGLNTSGQFGNNTTGTSVSPVTATLAAGYVAQAAGANHACGVAYNGVVRCWGSNASGQFGDGSTTNALVPTPINNAKFNVDSFANLANTDVYFVSVGDSATQKEILWSQLESFG